MSKRKRSVDPDSSSSKKRPQVVEEDDSEDEDDLGANENDESVIESSLREPSMAVNSKKSDTTDPIAGVIKRISMSNFMCHNRLEVTLGSHVNFIVGRNGSGKSAVVTALVVGLGGKASTTNRGSSIKNFVKSGKRSAWVEIVLNNKGKDNYKPHIYGEKIIINRRFNADGGSSYAIKSAKGQHISARRDELSRITDHLNIQVDNPVSILNQDTSRNFLNSKSAGDKFKFFMKATQLEQMSSDYDHVRRSKESAKLIIQDKEQTLPKMKAEVHEWKTKFKNMTAISELKVKVQKLKDEMAWALVKQRERGLEPLQKSLNAEVQAMPKFKKKVDESKEMVESWEVRYKEVEARFVECSHDVKSLEPTLEEKKKEMQLAKDKLQPISMELKACERELNLSNRDCKQCQERINELKTIASHDYEAERRQREEKIAHLESELQQLAAEQKVKEHEVEQFRGAVARHKSDQTTMENHLRTLDKRLRESQNLLNELKQAKNDRLKRFGAWMPQVIASIKKSQKNFHKCPIGPIGACFDLVDQKWAMAVETCLKGLVSAFLVHDHHDEQRLLNCFNDVPKGRRPVIITSAFCDRRFDVSRTRCQSDRYPCLMDVIKCDNPVVINSMIDQRGIEKVLLVEQEDEARGLMLHSTPRNAKECFTVEGTQMYSEPMFRYYSNDKKCVKFLMADAGEQIKTTEQEIQRLNNERGSIIDKRERLQTEINKNSQEERKVLTQINKIKEKSTRISFDINELKNMEDPMPVDVTTLEEEVATFQMKIQELTEKRNKCLQDKTVAEKVLDAAKKSYANVEASKSEKCDSGLALREEITQAQMEVEKAKNDRKHYMTKLKEQERKIQELETEVQKYKTELDSNREKASNICPEINTRRTPTSIENELKQIQKCIETEEQKHGNEKEITDTYKEKKQMFDKVQSEVKQLKNYFVKLDEVLERRQRAYLKMRMDIASRTKYYFIHQLYQRSFTGRMNFDFVKQSLDIFVNPSQDSSANGSSNEAKDLKSLSGGERSFSTVCFILSLWEAMEAPFRCLDEFDVFMDMVNRRVSMDMMLETADMHKDMQFVFLTPQDMKSVRKIDNVKIFRMPDPERSQKTLNFSQDSTSNA